jgi:hypothetical protein
MTRHHNMRMTLMPNVHDRVSAPHQATIASKSLLLPIRILTWLLLLVLISIKLANRCPIILAGI